jgi:ferredoxin
VSKQFRVNPIRCEAHGVCAELLPELIGLDPWGYPILAKRPVPADLMPLARSAVTACPALALLLVEPADRSGSDRSRQAPGRSGH